MSEHIASFEKIVKNTHAVINTLTHIIAHIKGYFNGKNLNEEF